MSWKDSVARALRDLKAEEARLVAELDSVRSKLASLGGMASGKIAKAKGGKRKMSAAVPWGGVRVCSSASISSSC